MTQKHIFLNLGGLVVLIGLLGLFYWQSTGVRAVPAMTAALEDSDSKVRIGAAHMLAEIGPAAKPAVPNLLNLALHDPVLYASTTAAGALGKIDLGAARQVMTANLAALQDPDVQKRRTACAMLGSLGPAAKPAVSALSVALDDPHETVRMHAVGALGEIGIPPALVVSALTRALHDKAPQVRHRALTQFAFSIPPTESVVPHLKELLEDKDRTVASLAQAALNSPHRQGNQAAIYTTMLQMGNANDYTLRQLAQLGPAATGAVPALIPILRDERPLHRYLAAEVLSAIGPGAREAVPELSAAMQDGDAIVRESVAEALQAIGPAGTTERTTTQK